MSMSRNPVANQRGMALVVALLVLVILSAIAAAMMMSVSTDRRLASYDVEAARALNYAESGVAEAIERIRRGDVPDTGDPKSVVQIFLVAPGTVPVCGPDTVALSTQQPDGAWLHYSSATKGPGVLTIAYKTDAARTQIYRYDNTKDPAVQTAGGTPVWVVTATGTYGKAKRTIVAEVAGKSLKVNLKAAVTTNKEDNDLIDDKCRVNGYDHLASTPTGIGWDGSRHTEWESTNPPMPGAWSKKKVKDGKLQGVPTKLENQTNPYVGPWQVFNMTQEEFYAWIGEPNGDKKQGNPRGITYVDRPGGKPQDAKGDFDWKGGFNGDGFLYVNGDLRISGDFTFRGLIYCEGKFEVHGQAWILGGVIAKKTHLHGKSGKYVGVVRSEESVKQNIAKYGAVYATLSWRELHSGT